MTYEIALLQSNELVNIIRYCLAVRCLHLTIHTKIFQFFDCIILRSIDSYMKLTWSGYLFVSVQAWHEYVNLLHMRTFMIYTCVESMILNFIIFSQAHKTWITLYQSASHVLNPWGWFVVFNVTSKVLEDGGVLNWCVIYRENCLWVFLIYILMTENCSLCFQDVNL